MKTRILILAAALALSGCAATQVEKARKKIPAGEASSLTVTVTTLGGWGGNITGKEITSDGKGRLTAAEYSETVNSPWVTYTVSLTDAAIGKTRLNVKPASEADAPEK